MSSPSKPQRSASSKKLRLDKCRTPDDVDNDFNFIMNFPILANIIKLLRCPNNCEVETLSLTCDSTKKFGLSLSFGVWCDSCEWETEFCSSHTYSHKNEVVDVPELTPQRERSGRKPFDINTRAVIAFREMGKGLTAIEKFCGIMNMKPPMVKSTYNDIIQTLMDVYQCLVDKSMKTASNELIPSGKTSADIMCGFRRFVAKAWICVE